MAGSLWHEVIVHLCLFNLQRNKKGKMRECCGFLVPPSLGGCLSIHRLSYVFVAKGTFFFFIVGLKCACHLTRTYRVVPFHIVVRFGRSYLNVVSIGVVL